MESKKLIVGTDIGGTFTDLVMLDRQTGKIYVEKVLTNHDHPALSISEGLDLLLTRSRVPLNEVDQIIHATTLATNALIERRGAITGLVGTKGHTDTIDLRSGARYDLYDLNIGFHPPLVPRYLRKGIDERTHANGQSLKDPSEDEIVTSVRELVEDEHIQSIAVCLLHSYANSEHERIVERVIRENFPSIFVSTSSAIAPRISEYDRFNTTIVNAFVQPVVSDYIDDMLQSLSKNGFRGQLSIMTCEGGLIDPEIVKQFPILLLESGPVAGAQIASYIANLVKLGKVFGFDMGGTTAKGCAIVNGHAEKDYRFEAARIHQFRAGSGITLLSPTIKLIEIGGGGGSIAWRDSRGTLQVGPRSSGSNPGPACYGLGGREPTVTDSDLVLGFLSPNYFLGGQMKLDIKASREAIIRVIGRPFNVDLVNAAWAIYDKVAEDIASAFRLHAAERGADLRTYSLVVFGGAGPVHGAHIAKKLGIKRVISPLRAGVLSACGLLAVPPQFSLVQTRFVRLPDLDANVYNESFSPLIERGLEFLSKAGIDRHDTKISRKFDMRYIGQGFEIEVEDPYEGMFTNPNALKEAFEDRYEHVYLLRGVSEKIEIVAFKVTLTGPPSDVDLLKPEGSGNGGLPARAQKGFRHCYFLSHKNNAISIPVYDRYSLSKGFALDGPAIVEEKESTCVVPPDTKAYVDEWNNLVLELL
jgi:N-methylhydantoinase A